MEIALKYFHSVPSYLQSSGEIFRPDALAGQSTSSLDPAPRNYIFQLENVLSWKSLAHDNVFHPLPKSLMKKKKKDTEVFFQKKMLTYDTSAKII